jgi:hypothetical protein|tara:strand:+ start:269 stop:520 length:252 start_codon:yes stop_codon:yes gene_type:complete
MTKIKIKNRDVSFRITGRGNVVQFLPSGDDLDYLDQFDELMVSKFLAAYSTKKTKLKFDPTTSVAAGYSIELDSESIQQKIKK